MSSEIFGFRICPDQLVPGGENGPIPQRATFEKIRTFPPIASDVMIQISLGNRVSWSANAERGTIQRQVHSSPLNLFPGIGLTTGS